MGGVEYRYEATETSSIDVDAVLAMYDNEEITRDQMVRLIKVDKTQASQILGGDQVADLEVTVVGKVADIRTKDLPVEQQEDEAVYRNAKVRRRVPRRRLGPQKTNATQTKTAPQTKRRVKIRKG